MRIWIMICIIVSLGISVPRARGDLLVSSRLSNKVLRYDDSAAFVGEFATGGNLITPNGVTTGPDGMLYVCSRDGCFRWNPAASWYAFASARISISLNGRP